MLKIKSGIIPTYGTTANKSSEKQFQAPCHDHHFAIAILLSQLFASSSLQYWIEHQPVCREYPYHSAP
jgi:hypothetical protein